MLVIGHRGAAGLAKENTLSSLKKAQELGVDMIEIDVCLTRDGQIVLSHDWNLKRLYGSTKRIADLTLAEVKELTSGEMPTLIEALAVITTPINVHVKVRGLEKQLLAIMKNFSSEVLISSTFPGVLEKIRALDENVKLGLVIGQGELYLLPILSLVLREIKLYSIHPEKRLVTSFDVRYLQSFKKKLFVWTVNDPKLFETYKSWNIDGVFTDNPTLIQHE